MTQSLDRHASRVEFLRLEMVSEVGDSEDVRDWVACLVHPTATHLATLGDLTWYARFSAQVMTDPALQEEGPITRVRLWDGSTPWSATTPGTGSRC